MSNQNTTSLKKILSEAIEALTGINEVLGQYESGLDCPTATSDKILNDIGFVVKVVSRAERQAMQTSSLAEGSSLDQEDNELAFYTIGYDLTLKKIQVVFSYDKEEHTLDNFVGQTSENYINFRRDEVAEKLAQFKEEFFRNEVSNYAQKFIDAANREHRREKILTSPVKINKHVLLDNGRIIAFINDALATDDDIEGLLSLGYQVLPIDQVEQYAY
jgi:hypothetical protein